MKRSRFAAVALALACVSAAPKPAAQPLAGASISGLDFIELEIAYTTLLARYYRAVAPRTLVDGARTGVAAALLASGVTDASLPFTPTRVDSGDGGDLIDALVVKQIVRYGPRVDGHRLVQAAVAGELAALNDPYTVLFHPQAFVKFNAFLGNERFGGVGVVISFDDSSQTASIDRVLPGGPADRAGLRRGDRFESIDGRAVAAIGGRGLRDALRGKAGTPVRLVVLRGGERSSVVLVRAEVRDPEVTTARFGDVGYAKLSRFGDRAGDELAAALGEFGAAGARAIVLDLRGNGGGYGDEATAVASAFVKAGPIFTTRERAGAPIVATATGRQVWSGPLAVLVDGDTASAAEIVAGAVQDDGIGTIVGRRTFGKGLVQSIFPLPDGSALKITTARYTTPKGRDIDRVGIVPDIDVVEPPGSVFGDPATDPQLARALEAIGPKAGSFARASRA
ncbi:MAG: S41 family peptidase [Candidatus Eremiobacteraeota bacterium]|nr:S41 family peptidase [Candidatus Eremiobacteraeota bacterium]